MNKPVTVTILNRYIKDMFMQNRMLSNVFVKGEVSNFKESHGNYYFSLKDEESAISCVLFARYRSGAEVEKQIENVSKLKDGDKIEITGKVSVYEKTGSYSIYVNTITSTGLGEYYIKLEALKKKLLEMGMFDESYKKEIPRYSMNIGVVTAENGAAIKDIVRTIKNKNPYASITLYPSLVQGENAYASIVDGIMTLDKMNMDVIIIGRGGGSIEDLYCFNDERVAYAIFNAKTPIISAVGHEINDSISDLVADLRVATPTAAGEAATFSYEDFANDIENYKEVLEKKISNKIADIKEQLENYRRHINLLTPKAKLLNYREKLENDKNLLNLKVDSKLNELKSKVKNYMEMLKTRDVLDKLSRGLSYTTKEDGKKVKSVRDVKKGDYIITRIVDGKFKSKIV